MNYNHPSVTHVTDVTLFRAITLAHTRATIHNDFIPRTRATRGLVKYPLHPLHVLHQMQIITKILFKSYTMYLYK